MATSLQIQRTRFALFARQPLSGFSRYTVFVLLFGTLMFTGIKLGVGHGGGPPLAGTLILFISAVAIASGLLWAPLLGVIALVAVLYLMYKQPFVLEHLQHPKEMFPLFVIVTLLYGLFLTGLLACVVALVQNYRHTQARTPGWFRMLLSTVGGIVAGAILMALLVQEAPAQIISSTTYTNGVPTVHMAVGSFEQSSVTISKGSKLLLVDDGNYHHELNMGSWVNGQPVSESLPGEPTLANGKSIYNGNFTLGPFSIAGTYHLYCSIHTGMMLTIIVQ